MGDDVKIGHADKLPLDLVPVEGIIADARAIAFGAKKYTPRGWEKSAAEGRFDYSVSFGALLRHLFEWWQYNDTDPESGLHHLDHAGANLKFLQTFVARGIGNDDRPV